VLCLGLVVYAGLDDGLNGESSKLWRMNFFDIDPRATGSLVIKDQIFSRGAFRSDAYQSAGHAYASVYSFQPNAHVDLELSPLCPIRSLAHVE
jgi:hypothetical protein